MKNAKMVQPPTETLKFSAAHAVNRSATQMAHVASCIYKIESRGSRASPSTNPIMHLPHGFAPVFAGLGPRRTFV